MDLIDGYATDKIENGYVRHYEAMDLPLDAAVCEIGVRDGGSLALWRRLCPDGRIVGVDINPDATWPPGTVRIVADQTSRDLGAMVDPDHLGFDLVVDDGCHCGHETRWTFVLLWHRVAPGGWYVIEDWQAEMLWPEHYAGMTSASTTEILSLLSQAEIGIESVTYRPGMVLIRKAGA